ncbi:oligopeptide transporter 6 [Gaeumannomyces tritici R3-111a-1]|uniref:Oligopeptide transporter 6 n=1 Tax=Gaeumannomyces tritici (strain R3-111a-1) TaxID=644352 RepID=J3NWR7_GAET3|nr:oligopeptide transporter 6 [Gaeumannomyces tritici R3-111a-1]EJT75799.1 oligopeptide transporter 6 [Gaeumannomyces tritici R3-111a-1]
MAVAPADGPDAITPAAVVVGPPLPPPASAAAAAGGGDAPKKKPSMDEKYTDGLEISSVGDRESTTYDEADKIIVPDDSDEFIDPRLKDYPVKLVAKTVSLHNDFSEPILTFRFWVLSTFWVVTGCAISSMYYFKPYSSTLTSYAIQLLSWGMGDAMHRWLPDWGLTLRGQRYSINPGPWNAKEHALVVVAYWGSCYTAYGLGPLSALETYYGKKISAGWGIVFLLSTQMIGYGFAGVFRDILVRPPKIYYPGVLPNVALFNARHKNPSVTKKSLKFFAYVAGATFVWQYFPGVIFPMLSSLPLLCYMGHGNWQSYPMYTPLWSNASQIAGAVLACWLIYPVMYFSNSLGALNYPPMSSGTFDSDGNKYNISRILTSDYTLNQTALDAYSRPAWPASYAMYFFWGFACSAGAVVYAALWYGRDSWRAVADAWAGRRNDYDDPYLKLMSRTPRVPHWWYLSLLAVCLGLSFGCIYGADLGLPWWGFILTVVMSNLNLISDYKFGFYMKIPEKEMFWGRVYGTLLGPFVNYAVMRLVIDQIGVDLLTGVVKSEGWLALKTKNYYSLSVLWGILGPKVFFSSESPYAWIYWAFLLGPALVVLVYIVHIFKPEWKLEKRCNPVVIMYGGTIFPVYQTTNLMTSALLSFFFMGYMLRYRPVWFRKYNYLLGVGLDCGTQICQTVIMLGINLPHAQFPNWWGNDADQVDRCFPPSTLPPNALN